jgi:glutamyl-tRNA reductase
MAERWKRWIPAGSAIRREPLNAPAVARAFLTTNTPMTILTVGLNHRTAPVEIRERLSFGPDILVGALRSLRAVSGVEESVILSTCNRTEICCALTETGEEQVQAWLAEFHGLDPERLVPYLYVLLDDNAVAHLLRVASGLDSMVLGEPQILGQVKTAFQTARDSGTAGKLLCRLFQHTFTVAKQVRTDTAIGSSPVSVAFAAVSLARQIFSDLNQQTALLIGAGEMVELAARHLHQHGVGRIVVANRTVERAHTLAAQFDGYAIALTELANHLPEADIVISSTASPLPVLGKGTVERALKKRKHRPIFMVDIAVPRDIEPEVGELNDIYLYTVDDLQGVVEEGIRSRREAAEQAEEIVEFHTGEFLGWLRSLDAVNLIQDYRRSAEAVRDEVLATAMRRLHSGKPPEEALSFLARTLTNKLLHNPSARLRRAGRDGEAELLEAANELFELTAKADRSS